METIKGKRYLPIEIIFTGSTEKELKNIISQNNAILQKVKNLKTGFWTQTSATALILVPEDNIQQFNRQILNDM